MKVAIVGAGLAGRLLAWRLLEHCRDAQQALSITLCDRQQRDHIGTGLVAAAMVAPFTEAVTTEAETRNIGVQSWALWQQWLPQLERATDQAVHFNQRGTLVVSHPADRADWQRFERKALADTPPEHWQRWDQQQLQQQEPELVQRFGEALYFPQEGTLDNVALYAALETRLLNDPALSWHEGFDCGDLPAGGAATQGYLAALDDQFDYIFDCRGNEARADLQALRSVRGEVLRVYAPEVRLSRAVRLMHPRYPLYIAPHPGQQYVIGATQIESDAQHPVTVRSALELLSALYSLHGGFAEAQIQSFRVGLRPAFADNQPRIVRENQLIRINGLFRHGYLFAPALINGLINEVSEAL
jgi:glycine oxidase